MNKVLCIVLVVTTFGNAMSAYLPEPKLPETPRAYAFAYGVQDDNSGNDFSHQETHNGVQTRGQYRVALPDGRIQLVTYTADENGYVAEVTYEGEARFPPRPQTVSQGQVRAISSLYAPPETTTRKATTTTTPAPALYQESPSGYLPLPLYQPPSASKEEPSRPRFEASSLDIQGGPFFLPSRTLSLPV